MPRCAPLFVSLSLLSAAAIARTEDRDVGGFDAIDVSSGIRVTATIGPRRPVRVEADDETLPLVETRVENGALHVGFKPHTQVRGEHPVLVTIEVPQLRAVAASGGSLVRARLTRSADVALQASGGSELHIGGIDADRLSVQGSGGSVLDLSGRASTLELQMSGGTRLEGRDLSTRDASLQASGGSQGELRADGSVHGSLSGGSAVHVRGRATARVSATGASQLDVDE